VKAKDWYRHTAWTPADREDFHTHLARARSHKRGGYLLIQAAHLQRAGTRDALDGALELLDLLLREYPGPVQRESACLLQARCLESLNRLDDALDSYRLAFQARRDNPNIRTYAPLYFGMFVVRHDRVELYAEAQAIFHELIQDNDLIFPDAQYLYFSANAIIVDRDGQKDFARACARKALEAAATDHSGSGRHPNLGLVEERDPVIERKLRKILNPGVLSSLSAKARN
jgi:tetratricopeptide (TPR) repeat protein